MSVRIKGGKELDAFLAQFPADLQRKALRNALRRGANVVRDEARLRVGRKSGQTAKAIKSGTRSDNGLPVGRVRLRGRGSFRGWLLEYGVGFHIITAKKFSQFSPSPRALNKVIRAGAELETGKRKGSLKINGTWVGGLVMHPGFAPKPFLRPALVAKAAEAVQAVGDYLREWLRVGTLQAPPIEADEE